MAYNPELKALILGSFESSADPQAPVLAQILREMELTIGLLTKTLCCPGALARGRREPCVFHWNKEQVLCERCGQLASTWAVAAVAALEATDGVNDFGPVASGESSQPSSRKKPEDIRALFQDLGQAVSELAAPGSAASGSATPAKGKCRGCGADLAANAKFCPACGRTVQGQKRCLNCSANIPPDAKFCPDCGAKVS